jgi:hypothetical protein
MEGLHEVSKQFIPTMQMAGYKIAIRHLSLAGNQSPKRKTSLIWHLTEKISEQ